jgi:hypothetical protein
VKSLLQQLPIQDVDYLIAKINTVLKTIEDHPDFDERDAERDPNGEQMEVK